MGPALNRAEDLVEVPAGPPDPDGFDLVKIHGLRARPHLRPRLRPQVHPRNPALALRYLSGPLQLSSLSSTALDAAPRDSPISPRWLPADSTAPGGRGTPCLRGCETSTDGGRRVTRPATRPRPIHPSTRTTCWRAAGPATSCRSGRQALHRRADGGAGGPAHRARAGRSRGPTKDVTRRERKPEQQVAQLSVGHDRSRVSSVPAAAGGGSGCTNTTSWHAREPPRSLPLAW